MKTPNWQPATTIVIVHAALTWITLATAEVIASFILKKTEPTIAYFFVAFGVTSLLCLAIPLLGSKPLVFDIQEICLYDAIVQFFGMLLFHFGQKSEIYLTMAQMIIVLKMLRLAWPMFCTFFDLPIEWPTFGLLGIIRRVRHPESISHLSHQQRSKMYQVLAAVPILVFLIQAAWVALGVPLLQILTIVLTLGGTRRLIAMLESREKEYCETQRALGVSEGEAAANARSVAELTAKNAELQALYDERNAMAQRLAAHNDRLGDSTHDLKHALVPLHYKANDILARALTDEQREDGAWLKAELKSVGDKMVKIIAEAQIISPVPSQPKLAIPAKELCDYFFTRFNPLALEHGVTLKCKAHGTTAFAICCDEELIKRILTNLLTNAITYAGVDADVHLSFSRARTGCWVRVLDSGPGIHGVDGRDGADNFITLLDKVAQAKLAANPVAEIEPESMHGNGVGLHSVYRLCQEAGITMMLQSRLGRGTAFCFKLPLAN